ncbi:MAG: hypothetical protein HQ514_11910, partial [Rhodospirillales bacterium]|nr:hypothetical protein [Rhodospirillales bacterium]
PALLQVREKYQGRFEIGHDLMVINIGDDISVRPAVISDKPWPVRPSGEFTTAPGH